MGLSRSLSRASFMLAIGKYVFPPKFTEMSASPPALLNPTFGERNPFPPLPPILDVDIRLKVFTHRSFFARPNHVFEDHPDDPSPDNEQLEHLGDMVLGFTVTRLLLDMYPNLRVGPSTKIRSMIVGNPTLASLSCRYNLPARLRLHPAQMLSLRASRNIQADVFEAYVGGLFRDQGLPAVEQWLVPLLKPYATEAYTRVRSHHRLPPISPPASPFISSSASASSISDASTSPTTPERSTSHRNLLHPPASGTPTTTGHLALFNQQLQRARREVEWVYDDIEAEGTTTTPIWAVRVEVDGEVFGHGRGGTKKAARNEAAKEGLTRMGIVV